MVKDNEILRLALNVSQVCKLRCKYCYANSGTYGTPGLMNKKVLRQALNFFLSKYKIHNIHIFGGAPLLNVDIIDEIFRILALKFNKKTTDNYSYKLVCSRKKLNHFIEICKAYVDKLIIDIVVNVDGFKEIHDYT
ncbi:radical SAM protein [Thermosipho melanesiensis]|uniref:radical SAM protein n=1 Tax=Thermosipho melanesiensis TaxID=46541 RepID=UPI000315C2BC|nr:radical SAM protein [Thermosipho melanesiensis]